MDLFGFSVSENVNALNEVSHFSVQYPFRSWKMSNKAFIEVKPLLLEKILFEHRESQC